MKLSVVIPTYRRGAIVLETARHLLAAEDRPDELILVDQSESHPVDVEAALAQLASTGAIRWLRGLPPSIPGAMNAGLRAARGELVLFLDDDIVPAPGLVSRHRDAGNGHSLVAGQVLQPGQKTEALAPGEKFRFNSPEPACIQEFMGGNFSVNRTRALGAGGFDENFIGAAYRFEAEFASRFVALHGPIRYEPGALINHLAISSGGTRAHGHHLRTSQPAHSTGAYYFLLRARPNGWVLEMLWRPLRSIRTRYHFSHPWRIPASLLAEWRGLALARRLHRQGPRLIAVESIEQTSEDLKCG